MSTVYGRKRMTKSELMDFLEWAFNQTDDEMCNYSNPRIAEMYMRDTGRYISVSTVRLNRDCWVKVDGKIIKMKPEDIVRL